MRVYITDSLGKPVNLNGIDWIMTLILHSVYPYDNFGGNYVST